MEKLRVLAALLSGLALVLVASAESGPPPEATALVEREEPPAEPIPGPVDQQLALGDLVELDEPVEGQAEPRQDPEEAAEEPVAPPVAVSIPVLGVESPLAELGLNPDNTVEVPEPADLAGWYTKGPKPGEVGPAVLIGHVDSYTGPGVFYGLAELQPGDEVHVHRADESVVTFVVQRLEQYGKDAFPTEGVYGNTDGPELRLITCGGVFDQAERSYRDNIVVYATPA